MPDSGRGSKSQSGEAHSQNETPEHHLRHTERQHEASPCSELPEPGKAAGQRRRTQRTSPCSLHSVHRHDRNDKGIRVQLANFNAVLPKSRIQLSKRMKTGAQRDASAHRASWALSVNKLVGETFSLNVTLLLCSVSPCCS